MGLSKVAIGRLLHISRLLDQQEEPVISSSVLEKITGYTSDSIRKDISLLEGDFSSNAGYKKVALSLAIQEKLGLLSERICCIVGLGRLGSAFIDYKGLEGSFFKIGAGFDSNVNRLEILQADFPLYPTFKMKEVIPRLNIEYAVLCVPPGEAQKAADKLADCGIKGIVNYAPVALHLPKGVQVENLYVSDALNSLAARIEILHD